MKQTRILALAFSALILSACGGHASQDGTRQSESALGELGEDDGTGTCQLGDGGKIRHVVYIQFDNTHLSRDNRNVPSDLEQMPHLLDFLKGQGALLANHHTPLIAHTATNILTAITGVYPDRHGVAVSNSYLTYDAAGKTAFAPSFSYWTDRASSNDAKPNMLAETGKNAPAPWVAYTRRGCDVGGAGLANIELENIGGDITNVFGAGSPEALEVKANAAQASADFVGIAVHCAAGSLRCAGGGHDDLLPDEPGGYVGFKALYGHKALASQFGAPLEDLDGNAIQDDSGHVGFPGFGGLTAPVALGYVAAMQEHGIPITYAYISDAHAAHTSNTERPFGPGEADYVKQLADYDAAFAAFFERLAAAGIDRSNTLFVFTSDEGDHFNGGAPSPVGCDGIHTPCTYENAIGELSVNLTGLLAQKGVTTSFQLATALATYVNGNPQDNDAAVRVLERAATSLVATNLYTQKDERLVNYVADRTEMGLLHMNTADPARQPSVTLFGNPDFFLTTGKPDCISSPCVIRNPAFAWNHGNVGQDINTTWLGIVGPGVRNVGMDHSIWSDHADVRPTMLALLGLQDDYGHQGRALVDLFKRGVLPRSLRAHEELFLELGRVYKAINAPVGRLALATLRIATDAAASGNGADDSRYLATKARLARIERNRDALAAKMESILEGATFQGQEVDRAEVLELTIQGEALLATVER
ncbi:MAG TPA: hypothetical protein VNO21_10605 [Polyangiaceae bacterium]|nr:hypothetical protein [Polyangiaceae bacterium]